MQERFDFLKIALSDRQIGAITRSSRYVVNAVIRNLGDQPLCKVVEYGPGDGVLTREILERMAPNGELIAIETNPEFSKILNKIEDSRLKVVNGTAQEVAEKLWRRNQGTIDLVVSSIPFSILKPADRESIIGHTFNMLRNSGQFIIFHQYSPLVLGLLNRRFGAETVNIRFELRNILPCFIMSARKQSHK